MHGILRTLCKGVRFMARKTICLLLVFIMVISFSGCSQWMDGTYYSVEKIQDTSEFAQSGVLSAESYDVLKNILVNMVEDAVQECTITTTKISQEDLAKFMEDAVAYVTTRYAMGAFFVDEITYEVGINGGKTAVAVDVSYNRSKSEILRIDKVKNVEEAKTIIYKALNTCEQGVAFHVDEYTETDLPQMVADYANTMPDLVMEIPQVSVDTYPESGSQRIIELKFTYQTSRDELRLMQEQVQPVFTAAQLYVSSSDSDMKTVQQLYSFLMERYDYTIETSITPSYSLLIHGVGDSRAFANVFSAICRYADISCDVITGTKNGSPWCWNSLSINGETYYLDLIQCSDTDGFVLRREKAMNGYVWDYSRIARSMPN